VTSRSVAVAGSQALISTGQPSCWAKRTSADGVVATAWRVTAAP